MDPIYKFKDWIDTNKIGWHFVCSNPKAIRIIEQNRDKIIWQFLCRNENAIHILEKNLDKIDWDWFGHNRSRGAIDLMMKNLDKDFWFSIGANENAMDLIEHKKGRFWGHLEWNTNPRAIKMMEERMKKGYRVCLSSLAKNPNAVHLIEQNIDKLNENYQKGGDAWRLMSRYGHLIHILEQNLDKIHWRDFSSMNSQALRVFEKYPDKINWMDLSQNKYAIPLLEKNLDKVYWSFLSYNENAVHILEKNLDKINWDGLSQNKNALHILEQNLDKKDKFNWNCMGLCEHVYEIDYKYLEERCNVYKEELIQKSMSPKKLQRYIDEGYNVAEIFEFI